MIDVYIWIGVWVVILIMLIISLTKIESRITEDRINKMFEYLKKRKKERLAMPRYIDADALREKMFHEAFEKDSQDQKWDSGCWIRYHMFENAVDSIPTADVVEVVRCKDCKWFNDFGCAIRIVDESDKPKENDFCSFGERREE